MRGGLVLGIVMAAGACAACAAIIGLEAPELDGAGAEAGPGDATGDAPLPLDARPIDTPPPESLATGLGFVRDLAVDDQFLYFAAYDKSGPPLARMPKGGGPSTVLIEGDAGTVDLTHIELDDAFVYATSYYGAGVRRLPRGGGAPNVVEGCNTALDVRRVGSELFYSTWDCGKNVRIRKRPIDALDAGFVESEIDTISYDGGYGFTAHGYLGIDDTTVFLAKRIDVRSYPRSLVGAPTILFVPDGGTINAMTTGERVFVAAGKALYSFAKDGSDVQVLVSGVDFGGKSAKANLALAGDVLYFTAPAAGLVARIPVKGGVIETVASGQALPCGLTLDAKYVYWANATDGSIWRRAR